MYIHMYIYISMYIHMYIHIYIYIYVCVPILWQHKFFSKCCRIGVGTPSFAQKRESLEKINIVIDVGNLGRKTLSVTSMVPKKGENYTWKKRRLFIGKNSSICSMTPESPWKMSFKNMNISFLLRFGAEILRPDMGSGTTAGFLILRSEDFLIRSVRLTFNIPANCGNKDSLPNLIEWLKPSSRCGSMVGPLQGWYDERWIKVVWDHRSHQQRGYSWLVASIW